jgi:hypothetical protein
VSGTSAESRTAGLLAVGRGSEMMAGGARTAIASEVEAVAALFRVAEVPPRRRRRARRLQSSTNCTQALIKFCSHSFSST